jgi:uncharacterized protein
MKDSPFIYGTTVSTHSFTNREEETKKLKKNLLDGINTTLISPRRWGKSSLVEKVIMEIRAEENNTKIVLIDLFSVGSENEFLELFAKEVIKSSSSNWQDWMSSGKDFFKKIIPKISIGIDPNTDFNLSFDWKELKQNLDEIINLPETICKKKSIKMIICLDEFQNLALFKDFEIFEKKLRATWQRQKSVTYCLYGSHKHMMAEIFNNPSKPFYRFGDIILLQKIETSKWINFIVDGFKNTGKLIDEETAALIPKTMKNHSWYVQQLSHYTWNLTSKKANREQIEMALKELIQANTPLYQREVQGLSEKQINFLKAIAKGEKQLMGNEVMQRYQLGTPRNISKNNSIFTNNDIIHKINETTEFIDPAFELWFKKQYFNEKYGLDV